MLFRWCRNPALTRRFDLPLAPFSIIDLVILELKLDDDSRIANLILIFAYFSSVNCYFQQPIISPHGRSCLRARDWAIESSDVFVMIHDFERMNSSIRIELSRILSVSPRHLSSRDVFSLFVGRIHVILSNTIRYTPPSPRTPSIVGTWWTRK